MSVLAEEIASPFTFMEKEMLCFDCRGISWWLLSSISHRQNVGLIRQTKQYHNNRETLSRYGISCGFSIRISD